MAKITLGTQAEGLLFNAHASLGLTEGEQFTYIGGNGYESFRELDLHIAVCLNPMNELYKNSLPTIGYIPVTITEAEVIDNPVYTLKRVRNM